MRPSKDAIDALFAEEAESPTCGDEISLVSAGGKGAVMFLVSPTGLEQIEAEVLRIDASLSITVVPAEDCRRVFVTRPSETWRVNAYALLATAHKVLGGWSNELEVVESLILGYSEVQASAWLRERRHQRVLRGITAYMMLEVSEFDVLCKSLDWFAKHDVWLFGDHADGLDRSAFARVPPGFRLLRLGLPPAAWMRVFASVLETVPRIAQVTSGRYRALHDEVTSTEEVLTEEGWLPIRVCTHSQSSNRSVEK